MRRFRRNNNSSFYLNNDDRYALTYYTDILNRQLRDIDLMYNEVRETREIIDYIMRVHDRPNRELYTTSIPIPIPTLTTPQLQPQQQPEPQPQLTQHRRRESNDSLRDYSYIMDFVIPIIQSEYEDVNIVAQQTEIERNTSQMIFSDIVNPLNTSCPIHLHRFENDSPVTQIIGCGHIFDRNGITNWFQRNVRCPVCRYDIRNNPNINTNTTDNQSSSSTQIPADASLNYITETFLNSLFTSTGSTGSTGSNGNYFWNNTRPQVSQRSRHHIYFTSSDNNTDSSNNRS